MSTHSPKGLLKICTIHLSRKTSDRRTWQTSLRALSRVSVMLPVKTLTDLREQPHGEDLPSEGTAVMIPSSCHAVDRPSLPRLPGSDHEPLSCVGMPVISRWGSSQVRTSGSLSDLRSRTSENHKRDVCGLDYQPLKLLARQAHGCCWPS